MDRIDEQTFDFRCTCVHMDGKLHMDPRCPVHPREVTLTEFLMARVAEDEAVVAARPGYTTAIGMTWSRALACALVSPARVLAECESKRRIVQHVEESIRATEGWVDGFDEVLSYLALPYANHPDFREEWM